MTIDTTITLNDYQLTANETALVTIQFMQTNVLDLDADKLSSPDGAFSNLQAIDEGFTWTATFTPNAGVSTTNSIITLDSSVEGGAASAEFVIDNVLPTATIVMADTALKSGETSTVAITFNEIITGLDLADFEVQGGALSNLVSSDGGMLWSATFTPTQNIESSGQRIVLNNTGIADLAGNIGAGSSESAAYQIDTKAPTATLSMSDTELTTGETSTVTVSFSERVNGMNNGQVGVGSGTLSTFASIDEGMTWSATFTPTAGVSQNNNMLNMNISGMTDLAGNGVASANFGYYSVNTIAPSGPTATVVLSDSALATNDTAAVTITFSEAVTGFDGSDVTVGSGTMSSFSSANGGITWNGTLTPGAGVQDYSNVVSVNLAGVTGGISGVAGTGTADSLNYWVDTKGPTATVVMADTTLTAGETSLVTITFSESVGVFNLMNVVAPNGTLTPLANIDEGYTWTTTFTPNANVSDTSNVVSVNLDALADYSGNVGAGVATSGNYAVNTAPTVVVIPRPPTTSVLVDGVTVRSTTGIAADGSKTQVVTIPTVTTGRVDQDGTAVLADIPLVKGSNGSALLSVGVPAGFGLKASGSATAKGADNSLTNLIAEIKAHSVSGSQSQDSMVGGGTSFLASLDTATPVLVQTIVLSAPGNAGVSSTPLVISGTAGTGSPSTALVIDAKALPAGSVIELQNVEFAAVSGNVSLVGGNGSQVIIGDGGSQNIFLGADDDILHGGGGNDIVGSAGGNDQIFGDEGDDIVFGGEGKDIIDGGTGNDIVKLVGASRADYSFRIDDGKLVMTHLNGGSDGTDIVSNVETLRFAGTGASVDVDFNDTDVAALIRMYDTAFGRNPDEAGLNFWIGSSEAGMSLHDIAAAMASSTEAQAQFGGMSNAAYVQQLYLQGLERTGTAQESKAWTDALDSGLVSRGDVLLGFSDSAEMIALVGVMDTSITTL